MNKDILRAATILSKSLVVLDTVVQDDPHSVVAQEVGFPSFLLQLFSFTDKATYSVKQVQSLLPVILLLERVGCDMLYPPVWCRMD